MDLQQAHEISKTEKITRFGFGAVLGLLFGLMLNLEFAFTSIIVIIVVITCSVAVLGYLALKYGDGFWYSLKNWDWY